jgi:hypothetical protein
MSLETYNNGFIAETEGTWIYRAKVFQFSSWNYYGSACMVAGGVWQSVDIETP